MMRRQQNQNHQQRRRQQDQQSKLFYELSSLVLSLLRSPPPAPIEFSDEVAADESLRQRPSEISPAGFALLMLGISMALMLCGSVTFFIGFLLMPWVIGLFFVFYVVGVVSTLSVLGRAVLCCNPAPPVKDIPAWKL